jgi:FemAB-related protein (PEP-CTERM system-associated)
MTATVAEPALRIKAIDAIRAEGGGHRLDRDLAVTIHNRDSYRGRLAACRALAFAESPTPLGADPGWLTVFQSALRHDPYLIEATQAGRTVGFVALCDVSSMLFGRYLVSLPYLNSNGIVADSPAVRDALIERAADLADDLSAKHLELRHEREIVHDRLNVRNDSKAHMRLPLPTTAEALWKGFDPKVRNQIRKAEKSEFVITWGGVDQLDDFMMVISQNMRDLGTPFYGRGFFQSILLAFPGAAEIVVLRTPDGKAVAAGLLLHGPGITEVPSASSLKEFNSTCANMLLYRHLLDRAIARGQGVFDFGRSTLDGPTFKFKKQWGAVPSPAIWQYASRNGTVSDARPDNPKYRLAIKLWKKLPVRVTAVLGPKIVRGIP